MRTTDTLVIGAGQAGLAMSRCLAERGVDHVVLERGRVAERWRTERWDSLRLLSPNWMSRLPGWSYAGPDPHGFMTAGEVVDLPRRLRDRVRRARGRGQRRRSASALDGDGFAVDDHRPDVARRARRHGHGLVRPARRAGARRGARPGDHAGRAVPLPEPRAGCPTAACSSSARRPRACSWPTSWPRPGDPSCWPSAGTAGCRGATAAWTSSGGSSASGAWTGPSTRWPTRPPPVASRRCSSSAGPTTPTSTWPRSRPPASSWPGASSASTGPPSASPATSPSTVATVDERRRQLLASIDAHIDATGLAAEVLDPEPPRPRRRRRRARPPRPAGAGHHHRHLGHRATGAATRGSRCPSSTPRARSATTGASRRSPGCTSSASASSTAAARASSTASAGTRSTSPTT